MMKGIEEVLTARGFEKTNIRKIFQIGSRVYGAFEKDSDYDFLVVYNLKNLDQIISEKEINIHLVGMDVYENNITKQLPFYLLTLWLPEQFVLCDKKSLVRKLQIDYNKIYETFTSEKNLCINKSLRYFDSNVRISLKNLVHAIRYFSFAVQIFERGYIDDYACANIYYDEIMKLNYKNWEEYMIHFSPIFEKIQNRLSELKKEFDQVIEKYNVQSKGLTVFEFLKEFKLKDLEKYFGIEVKGMEGLFFLNATNYSNRELIIPKECNPLILDNTLNFVAKGISNYVDSKYERNIPKLSKNITVHNYNPRDTKITFYFNYLWRDYSMGVVRISNFVPKSREKYFIHSYTSGSKFIVVDRETLQEEISLEGYGFKIRQNDAPIPINSMDSLMHTYDSFENNQMEYLVEDTKIIV
jgi:predicted nucleotidyltransferase